MTNVDKARGKNEYNKYSALVSVFTEKRKAEQCRLEPCNV